MEKNDNVINITMEEALGKYNAFNKTDLKDLTKEQVQQFVRKEYGLGSVRVETLPSTGFQVWMSLDEKITVVNISSLQKNWEIV